MIRRFLPLFFCLVAGVVCAGISVYVRLWWTVDGMDVMEQFIEWPRDPVLRVSSYVLFSLLIQLPTLCMVLIPLGYMLPSVKAWYAALPGTTVTLVWIVLSGGVYAERSWWEAA